MCFPDDCLFHVTEQFPPFLRFGGLQWCCTSKRNVMVQPQEKFVKVLGLVAVPHSVSLGGLD